MTPQQIFNVTYAKIIERGGPTLTGYYHPHPGFRDPIGHLIPDDAFFEHWVALQCSVKDALLVLDPEHVPDLIRENVHLLGATQDAHDLADPDPSLALDPRRPLQVQIHPASEGGTDWGTEL